MLRVRQSTRSTGEGESFLPFSPRFQLLADRQRSRRRIAISVTATVGKKMIHFSHSRYMPPVTPSTWKNTRLADHFSPVCPQSVPVSDTGMEALLEMPRGRLAQLRRMKSMLTNHSEDCLYLNMYIPREGESRCPINHSCRRRQQQS